MTESILAEILAEAERVVQPNVPYKVMKQELPIIKPIKAVSSEERSRYENTANCKFQALPISFHTFLVITPERAVKANLFAPIQLKNGVKHFKALWFDIIILSGLSRIS